MPVKFPPKFTQMKEENLAIRQQLGHTRLPQFVGDIDDQAPYHPEEAESSLFCAFRGTKIAQQTLNLGFT